jgi:hypothetical protein
MPLRIPGDIRAAVIRDWLNGKPRDAIARDNSASAGNQGLLQLSVLWVLDSPVS